MAEREGLWAFIKRSSHEFREALAREGYAMVNCSRCGGTGEISPGRVDRDAHGSFWSPGQSCTCSMGRVKVAIPKEEQAAAMRRWLKENGFDG